MLRDIDEIIEKILRPELTKECNHLGIPESFIKGIHSIFPKPFEYSSFCEPIEENGRVEGVRIRIDCEINQAGPALRDFLHEMRHAKDYYEGKNSSELKAVLYSWIRYFERLLCGGRVK